MTDDREGGGSAFCRRYRLERFVWAELPPSITRHIAHKKRVKHWRREWKFSLIERSNLGWRDPYDHLPDEKKCDPAPRPQGIVKYPWRGFG